MAVIPPFFLDTVVAVGAPNKGDTDWLASGFLYGRYQGPADEPGKKRYRVFFVTNRHVLADLTVAVLRFNPEANEPARQYDLGLKDAQGAEVWVPHPDPEVDVAVSSINVSKLEEDGIRFSYFHSDETVLDRAAGIEAGLSEGDGAFVLGFPMGLVGEGRSFVIVRGGVLARVRDWLAGGSPQFLVDCLIFPGNSGGPVVLRPELTSIEGTKPIQAASLIGIVHSYLPYQDIAVSNQTRRPRIIFEENSGLAAVHSVDQIEETIDAWLTRFPPAGGDSKPSEAEGGVEEE